MRRRIACILALAMALALLAVPSAAARTVYFTAVNENILELKDETMPFWSGQNIYVDSAIFSDRWLGLYCNRNRENGTVVIWETSGQRRALLFELDSGYVSGSDGNNYSPSAIQKNGRVFVPAGVVADYFGLIYSNVRVDHGFLIWLHSADATVSVLTAQEFANAASYQMSSRYQRYLQAQEAGQEDPASGEEPAVITGKTLNLCFRMGTAEHAGDILSVLGQNGAKATFYLTEDEIRQQPDTVRHMAVAGHRIGILLTGSGDPLGELRSANEALFLACGGKTRALRRGERRRGQGREPAGGGLLPPLPQGGRQRPGALHRQRRDALHHRPEQAGQRHRLAGGERQRRGTAEVPHPGPGRPGPAPGHDGAGQLTEIPSFGTKRSRRRRRRSNTGGKAYGTQYPGGGGRPEHLRSHPDVSCEGGL